MVDHGAKVLSEAELLALILRTGARGHDAQGIARELLDGCGGLEALVRAPLRQLEAIAGLGPAKSASLIAVGELAIRLASAPLPRREAIRSPEDVHRHLLPRLRLAQRESFRVLLLDGRHRLIGEEEVSVGTLTASLVHPREVFREAIRVAAAAVLLVHNHPSGDPSPSAEDRTVTARLRAAGELIGIQVVDHVIVAEGGHYSFREAGEDFERSSRSATGRDP